MFFFSSCPLTLRLQFFSITQFKRIMKRPTALRSLSFSRFHNIIDAPAVWYLCYLPALFTPPVCIPGRPTFVFLHINAISIVWKISRHEQVDGILMQLVFAFIEFGENV